MQQLLDSHSTELRRYTNDCRTLANDTDKIEGRFFNAASRFQPRIQALIGRLETRLDSEKAAFTICMDAQEMSQVYGAMNLLVDGIGSHPQPWTAEPLIHKLARTVGIRG